ncbi:LLM class flavin-dependent oxidoreductase [Acidisoma cellulosilytica]|uniref:LLM class flavin-dependent oxidoreductase n=1 Tax=Acidisoma cellulosilyticum TaxID=2802395 RepID=A0A964E582_9PROT|nr:LLM class flavin-dependent oxidoreductase [Acidisoma cellulosilyticum]MCB8882435.1 LLM class flavin-dependent oxidoreductase [Acidisoma cellulosilyticum]
MSGRKMHLVAFLMAGPTCHHHGAWRHPETDVDDILTPERYEHIARVLEAGKFDALFFADILGIYDTYNSSFATMLGRGGQLCLLDPAIILPMMARVTDRIGLGLTCSTTFFNPYQIARQLGTLDHLSRGRVAWNVVASHSTLEANNFGLAEMPSRAHRYDRSDEVLEACMALWNSWDEGALVLDKKQGIFADASKVHYADYNGQWIKTRGPLTVPRSPQGHPVIMQAGSSDRGRDFGARWGEIIFTLQHQKGDMQTFYKDFKGRMAARGRAPESCVVLPSIDVVIGETESIARERADYVNGLVDTQLGMACVSGQIGYDLSQLDPDQPLKDVKVETGSRGTMDVILQGTEAEGLTLGEAARRFATSELCPQLVGTPEMIADKLIDLFQDYACDGFVLTPTTFPGMYEQFAKTVVPILQERGVFRKDYAGSTLREHLQD